MTISPITFTLHSPMRSASAVAENRRYHCFPSPRGRYFVADQLDAADYIYHEQPADRRGFGGRTINFTLVDDTIISVPGPWHTNADDLHATTGIDLRNLHFTQGIVAHEWKLLDFATGEYSQILHYDTVPMIGPYDRIEKLAKKFSEDTQSVVYYAVRTAGGGMSSCVYPLNHKFQ